MIKTAKSYIGTPYIVGDSGQPQTGVDCSGLIMQVMYSIGLNPLPISPLRHALPDYEYESYSLTQYKHMKHYSWNQREKGDLIFFHGKNGRVNHVGLYIGNDQVIEAVSSGVVMRKIDFKRLESIECVGRLL